MSHSDHIRDLLEQVKSTAADMEDNLTGLAEDLYRANQRIEWLEGFLFDLGINPYETMSVARENEIRAALEGVR